MTDDPMVVVRGRADAIKRALSAHKLPPNALTAAALCYLAMRLLGLRGPQIDEFLASGPFGTIREVLTKLEAVSPDGTPAPTFDPDDPEATITMKQSELWAMIDGASRNKPGSSH